MAAQALRTRRPALVTLPAALLAAASACTGFTAQAGYMQVEVAGRIALAEGTGGTASAAAQDIGSAFGLGDPQGSPYLRAQMQVDRFAFAASVFTLRESGQGQLEGSFGGLPASTPVATDLEFACAKLSATYAFDLGFVTLAPGLAIDVLDLEFRAQELTLGNAEVIDEILGVPMLFLRAQAALGPVDAVLEVGYLDTPRIDSSEGRFLDVELLLRGALSPSVEVFAGYRLLDIDANGDTGTDSFAVDLQVRGWVVGGGLRF
ncbi:MAG: hypothetical protein KF830_12380 [Planctomycetes bacterium]|nr:hypothetical protein [Planctomycetota bacterium]